MIIKRKNEFLELVPRGNNIPESPSPSNDPWFDDSMNLESVRIGIEQARKGETIRLTPELQKKLFEL